jgi:hypothetical protein
VVVNARAFHQNEPLEKSVLTSGLLAGALPEGASQTRPCKILDFGAISSDTVNALQTFFWGRLTVLDAVASGSRLNDLLNDPDADLERTRFLEELFSPAIGQAYDLVLLWDFAGFFCEANLPWLDTWLDALVTQNGHVHGFLCHNSTRKIERKEWGLHSQSELSCKTLSGFVTYQHLRNQFTRHLRSFVIEKSVLLKDGRLEVLLKRR